MNLQGSGGVDEGMKLTRAIVLVGRAIENEFQARLLRQYKIQKPATNAHHSLSALGLGDLIDRRSRVRDERRKELFIIEWTSTIRARVGRFCVNVSITVASVTRTIVEDGVA